MTAQPANDLPALIGSRICHDLISPLGAIGNGLELLQLSGQSESPEMALIAQSVETAQARIRFFRIAYGAASPAETIDGRELRTALQACFATHALQVDWTPETTPRHRAKLAFLMLQCLETALPYGGRISVVDEDARVSVRAEAERMALDPTLFEALSATGAGVALRPAQVQFGLLAETAEMLDWSISVEIAENALGLSCQPAG